MKRKKNRIFQLILPIVLAIFTNSYASDTVEWEIIKTLDINAAPKDVAISPDGKRIFVLTDNGNIRIYSSGPTATHIINIGMHVDQIKMGPRGQTLILSSRMNQKVQIVKLDFIQTINVSGSPFKGPADAPVVIAVFNDFQ